MRIESKVVPIDSVRPIEKNVRLHPRTQIEELKRSFEMFGQYRPLVVSSDGTILCGNGLYQALLELGVETVEVKRLPDDADESFKTKLMLADNRIFMLGADAASNIDEIIADLGDYDIPGFDASVLEELYDVGSELDSFGVLGEARRAEIENAADARSSEPRGDVTHADAEKRREESGETVFQNAPMTEAERHAGNYVTCPNCGMKIWA